MCLLLSTPKTALVVSVSATSRKFHVPDALAHVYDFANTLDLRSFVHNGVRHRRADEFESPKNLAEWLALRGLLKGGRKLTQESLDAALRLRASIREYLERDPTERHLDSATARKFNEALEPFPFVVGLSSEKSTMTMRTIRHDALAGIGAIVAQLYDGSASGILDRLKMCASEECRRVFYDRSKPSTRRWCQADLCGNRMKTRAYRARRKT